MFMFLILDAQWWPSIADFGRPFTISQPRKTTCGSHVGPYAFVPEILGTCHTHAELPGGLPKRMVSIGWR